MDIVKKHIKKYRKNLALGILFAAINQIFSLLNPQVFARVVDNYASHHNTFTQQEFIYGVGSLLLVYIGVALISRTAKAFQDYYMNVVSERVGTGIYNTAVRHIFELPFSRFEDQQSGNILQILQKARDHIKKLVIDMVGIGFFSLVGMAFVIIYAFIVHWSIGLVFTLSIPIVGLVIYYTGRSIKKSQEIIIARSGALAASTTETLQNIDLVKSLGLEDQEIDRLNTVHEEILELELEKVIILRKLSFIQGTLINAVSTLIIFVSMILIYQNAISLGEFLALWFYGFFVFGPLGQFAGLVQSHQETIASSNELQKILESPKEEIPGDNILIKKINNISYSHVSFQYSNTEGAQLKDISFSMNSGKTIAFVGPSGAGKSTIIKTLLGLHPVSSGSIRYNNTNIQEINIQNYVRRLRENHAIIHGMK